MTWVRVADGAPVRVQAHRTEQNGSPQVQLTINGQATAFLSEDDAASLGGYLLAVTNNDAPLVAEAAPEKKGALPTNHWAQSTPEKEVGA